MKILSWRIILHHVYIYRYGIVCPSQEKKRNIRKGHNAYLTEYAQSEEGAKIYTIIDLTVNGEPLDPEKNYRVASGFNIDKA